MSSAGPAEAGRRLRVLALSLVPYVGAGCRFRIAHYIPFLATQGIDVTIAPFYDRRLFRVVYEKRRLSRKAWLFLRQTAARIATVAGAGRYDAIWIYREAFPIGPPLLEGMLHALGRPLIYDFDDAVFLPNTSEANRYVGALKYVQKIGRVISYSDEVIAGNEYLADYARRFNSSVHVIPTAVDTHLFVPRTGARSAAAPTIGWIGTPTTAAYLAPLGPVLTALATATEFTFRVSGAGTVPAIHNVKVETPAWSLEREVELFNTCDIGVYPLPDDDWARGKCGFKAIQFMACGVPVVASPVGVNREIIEDGVNGFLAAGAAEWNRKLGRLLADAGLRRQIGLAARRTIEERYSLEVNAPRVAGVMRRVVERRGAATAFAPAAGDQR